MFSFSIQTQYIPSYRCRNLHLVDVYHSCYGVNKVHYLTYLYQTQKTAIKKNKPYDNHTIVTLVIDTYCYIIFNGKRAANSFYRSKT